MSDSLRDFDVARDLDAVLRMWIEVGWLEGPQQRQALEDFLAAGTAQIAEVDGDAECLVHWSPGTIHYGFAEGGEVDSLPLCAVTAVTTSPVARRKGFASRLTAEALARGAESGCAVAALGMFEQGFYDRMGFGTAAYENIFRFDPANLDVGHVDYRSPIRLGADDYRCIHQALSGRLKHHGSVNIDSDRFIQGEFGFLEKSYSLGYRDGEGRLTHFLSGPMKGEHGPWNVRLLAYQSVEQLLELFRLLRELSDQVRSIRLAEPAHVQLQALLREPFRERNRSEDSPLVSGHEASAWMQLRILDLDSCLAVCRLSCPELRFNLRLNDPLESQLTGDWRGVGGDYSVVLGGRSAAKSGHQAGLPLLTADVGAFTRLWFGVRPASVLAVTDRFDAPSELLEALDRCLVLPRPVAGLDF